MLWLFRKMMETDCVLRSALFCDMTLRVVVIPYRPIGKIRSEVKCGEV